jgi:hypothetical protein
MEYASVAAALVCVACVCVRACQRRALDKRYERFTMYGLRYSASYGFTPKAQERSSYSTLNVLGIELLVFHAGYPS